MTASTGQHFGNLSINSLLCMAMAISGICPGLVPIKIIVGALFISSKLISL